MSAYARFGLLPSGSGSNSNRRKKQTKPRRQGLPASSKAAAAAASSSSKSRSRSSQPEKKSRISFRGVENRTGKEVVAPAYEPPMSQLTEGSYGSHCADSQEQNHQLFLQQQPPPPPPQQQKPAAQEQPQWNQQSQNSASTQSSNGGFQDVLPLGQRSVATSASTSRGSSASTHASRGFLQARRDMENASRQNYEPNASAEHLLLHRGQQGNAMKPPPARQQLPAQGQGPPAVYHREQQQQQPFQAPMQATLQQGPPPLDFAQGHGHGQMMQQQQQQALDERGMQAHYQFHRPEAAPPIQGVARAPLMQQYEQDSVLARDRGVSHRPPYQQPQGVNPLLKPPPRRAATGVKTNSAFPSSKLWTIKRETSSSLRRASNSRIQAVLTPGRRGLGGRPPIANTPGRQLKEMLHNAFLEYKAQLEAKTQEGAKALDDKIEEGNTELTKTAKEGATALDSKIEQGTQKMDDMLQEGCEQQKEREEYLDSKGMELDAVAQDVKETHRSILDLIKSFSDTLLKDKLPGMIQSVAESMGVGSFSAMASPSSASKAAKARAASAVDSHERPKKKARLAVTPSPASNASSNQNKVGSSAQVRRSTRIQGLTTSDNSNKKEKSAPELASFKTPPPSRKAARKKFTKTPVSVRPSNAKHRKPSKKAYGKASTDSVACFGSGSSSKKSRGTSSSSSSSMKIRFRIPDGLKSPTIISKPASNDSFLTPPLKSSSNKKASGGSSKRSIKAVKGYGQNRKKTMAPLRVEDYSFDPFEFLHRD